MIEFFNRPWDEVPTVWIDTETTGTRPGVDKAVQVGIARFERGEYWGGASYLVFPDRKIPEEATAVHGITDAMVRDAPLIGQIFTMLDGPRGLLDGAHPAAYNAPFDRQFAPPLTDDWTWPWLDCLSLVRVVDRFVKGPARHTLSAACSRHGVELIGAHDALADAIATGKLFYKLAPIVYSTWVDGPATIGQVLQEQRIQEAREWFRFNEWRSRQPPKLPESKSEALVQDAVDGVCRLQSEVI